MTKIDFNQNKLIQLFANLPKGYGEGLMMNDRDARRIAESVIENFFIVPLEAIPDSYVDKDTLTAREQDERVYTSFNITVDDSVDDRYLNILAHIANYFAAEEIQTLLEEKQKQNQKDIDLAFSLLKVADPLHLKYVKWEHVPRSTQDAFLNVARKAREELAEK